MTHTYPVVSFGLAALCAVAASAAPPDGGAVSIETRVAAGIADTALPPFVAAMSDALAAHGFTILDGAGHAAYVAEVMLDRTEVGTGTARIKTDKVSAGPGGVRGGAGVGALIPLPGGSAQVPLERTRLEVHIRKRGDTAVVWDGSAVIVRPGGTREGANEVVAAALGNAVLRNYPAQPDAVVGVP